MKLQCCMNSKGAMKEAMSVHEPAVIDLSFDLEPQTARSLRRYGVQSTGIPKPGPELATWSRSGQPPCDKVSGGSAQAKFQHVASGAASPVCIVTALYPFDTASPSSAAEANSTLGTAAAAALTPILVLPLAARLRPINSSHEFGTKTQAQE